MRISLLVVFLIGFASGLSLLLLFIRNSNWHRHKTTELKLKGPINQSVQLDADVSVRREPRPVDVSEEELEKRQKGEDKAYG